MPRAAGIVFALAVAAAPVGAQEIQLRGYALNVFLAAAEGPFTPSGIRDAQRLRLMLGLRAGQVAFDLAYEHLLSVVSTPELLALGVGAAAPAGSGDWLPFQGTLDDGDHHAWRHRMDRAALSLETGFLDVTVGRQTVSWGTTLFLTPADPFAPFDPADPFREYRAGVDAIRLRTFPGPLSEIEGILRPAIYGSDTTLTALVRGRAAIGRAELTGWGGLVHDEAAASVAGTVALGGGVLRAEAVVRRDADETVLRVAIGADRSFSIANRTLYVVAEYQRDGFGAASGTALPALFTSAPYQRGELQVLGRDEFALQTTYQLHPLVGLDALGLWNAGDGSVLLAPAIGLDAGAHLALRAGLFLGLGPETSAAAIPASEYGAVPVTGYVAGSVFF
ncbi:MAG: hypothetical protein OER21_04070 [Gemmatimonadota bacterium]|nr:hypothetical protein [Gemmatimonadota bacterium]